MTYPKDNAPDVTWTVADAKAKFSEMMDCARTDGPQTITKNGRPAVVIVSAEEWAKKTQRRGRLVDFLASSPLRGVDVAVGRKRISLGGSAYELVARYQRAIGADKAAP